MEELKNDPEALLDRYTKPTLVLPLRLFESVMDIQSGRLLLHTQQGAHLITGLTRATQMLHLLPTPWVLYALELVSKTIWMAMSTMQRRIAELADGLADAVNSVEADVPTASAIAAATEATSSITTLKPAAATSVVSTESFHPEVAMAVKALGQQVILLARKASVEVVKSSPGCAPGGVYKALCQAAVIASNMLSLELFEPEPQAGTAKLAPQSKVVESCHPHLDSTDQYEVVEIRGLCTGSGAECYSISFDGRSSLSSKLDYLRFYRDDSKKTFWGDEKYYGTSLPGVGGAPPLLIPSSRFVVHFHTTTAEERDKVSTAAFCTINIYLCIVVSY